jgi:hypothetical protein
MYVCGVAEDQMGRRAPEGPGFPRGMSARTRTFAVPGPRRAFRTLQNDRLETVADVARVGSDQAVRQSMSAFAFRLRQLSVPRERQSSLVRLPRVPG